jgi:hypothetical protein
LLPLGGTLRTEDCRDLITRLSARLALAKTRGYIAFTPAAVGRWQPAYAELSRERAGTLGHVTSRAPAHVRRLAVIYALSDGAEVVDTVHLEASLALWDYCLASAECIFGGLSARACDMYEQLRLAFPSELDRTALHQASGRNARAEEISGALAELAHYGLATSRKEPTDGAPRELWRAVTK